MEYVYAALILHAAGKEVTEEGVTNVLNAAGATINEARTKALIAALEGIDIDDAISKAAFVGAPTTAAATAPTPVETKEEAKAEEKKEEEKEKEEEEETGMEGLGALFG
ncbi:MAG TPA: 50S ribosomal protein P1 [Candidatus Acidoferrales bacterium]|jgi:large subunit ribosomal protein L12|nr:50S ribosomal protein P1 [Candidatus Acidoferrales bacterium]